MANKKRLSAEPLTVAGIINAVAEQYAPGDDEFKKVMNAIALAESGGNPGAVGDAGNSIGLYQNNMAGGRGAGYSADQLKDPHFNADLAARELIKYYNEGRRQGLSGGDLVAYVSRTGQRPAAGNEWNAAANYGRLVGNDTTVATNEPQMDTPPAPPSGGFMSQFVPKAYAAEPSKAIQPAVPNTYAVKPGDTMWGIAQRTLGNGNQWKQLQGYQGNPTQLPVGTQLRIPNASRPQTNTSTPQGPVYSPPPADHLLNPIMNRTFTQKALNAPPKPTYTPVPKPFASSLPFLSALGGKK